MSFRYVQPNGAATNAAFEIPVDKCGTNVLDIDGEDGTPPKRGFENIVVFQNDPTYQEVYDHARMVVCRYTLEDDFDLKEKRVVFRPVVIDMLDVVSVCLTDFCQYYRLSLFAILNRFRSGMQTDNSLESIVGWK